MWDRLFVIQGVAGEKVFFITGAKKQNVTFFLKKRLFFTLQNFAAQDSRNKGFFNSVCCFHSYFLIDYSLESLCASVCVCMCVSMCVCFCTITQKEIDLGT